MKKLVLTLGVVWAALACQPQDATVSPLKKPVGEAPERTNGTPASLPPAPLDLPPGTQLIPLPTATHGVYYFYTRELGRTHTRFHHVTISIDGKYAGTLTKNAPEGIHVPAVNTLPGGAVVYAKKQPGFHPMTFTYYGEKGDVRASYSTDLYPYNQDPKELHAWELMAYSVANPNYHASL
ncbi:hypothetical protein GCM10027299_45330 [Larkinella ripae]